MLQFLAPGITSDQLSRELTNYRAINLNLSGDNLSKKNYIVMSLTGHRKEDPTGAVNDIVNLCNFLLMISSTKSP